MIFFWENRNSVYWSLNQMYSAVGISKQGFYKHLYRYQHHQVEKWNLIYLITQIRKDHPTMSCRSMYHKLKPLTMGRDRFVDFCKTWGFLTERKQNLRRTTDSFGVIRFDNLLKNKVLTAIDQAWSSDITYFELGQRFYYLTFIMDCFSRRILGYSVSKRLTTEKTTLIALKKAIKTRKNKIGKGIVFHSDGGGQYYDKAFIQLTEKYAFKNSMCMYAYENGKAERLNGIIKNCYLKHWDIQIWFDLQNKVARAVNLYNLEKPHSSLYNMTPVEFENNKLNLLNKPSVIINHTTSKTPSLVE